MISEFSGSVDKKSVRLAVHDGGGTDSHSMTNEVDRIGEFLRQEMRELVLRRPFLSDEVLGDERGGPVDRRPSAEC